MDERLKSALEFSKYRVNHFNIKENIKLKVDGMLTYAINGGIFKIDRDLIAFVKIILEENKPVVVLIDTNGNPIEIADIRVFYDEILSKYFEATNFYIVEYTKLKKAKSSIDQFDNLSLGD
jgi:hypothetical protein